MNKYPKLGSVERLFGAVMCFNNSKAKESSTMLDKGAQAVFKDFCAAVENTESRQARLGDLIEQDNVVDNDNTFVGGLDNIEYWLANHRCFTEQIIAESETLYNSVKQAIFDTVMASRHRFPVDSETFTMFIDVKTRHYVIETFLGDLERNSTINADYWFYFYIHTLQAHYMTK